MLGTDREIAQELIRRREQRGGWRAGRQSDHFRSGLELADSAGCFVEQQKVMAAGFDGFQGKPISVRELLETIRKVLASAS